MRPKMGALIVAALAIAGLVAACGPGAAPSPPAQTDKPAAKEQADKPAAAPPGSITIGSNPSGTVFYSVSGGLAKVMSDAGLAAVVQPYTGTSTFLPLINSGELDMGVVNAVDMAMAFRGPDKLKVGGRARRLTGRRRQSQGQAGRGGPAMDQGNTKTPHWPPESA